MSVILRPLSLLAVLALGLALMAAVPATASEHARAGGPLTGPTAVSDVLLEELEELGTTRAIITAWDRAGLDAVHAALGTAGVTETHTLTVLPMVLTAGFTADALSALEGLGEVRSVYEDGENELHMQESTYVVGARDTWAGVDLPSGFTGAGIELGVVDSGAAGQHKDYGNLVEFCYALAVDQTLLPDPLQDFAEAFEENLLVCNDDVGVSPSEFSFDEDGHGTHVAGTMVGTGAASGGREAEFGVVGIAPDATIRSYNSSAGPSLPAGQILNSYDDMIRKKRAGENNIVAINNSFGGGAGTDYDPDSPQNIAYRTAHEAGMLPVFSAGNSGPEHNTLGSQCVNPFVLCVGANTKPDWMAGFSSVGRPASVADTNRDGEVGGEGDVAPANHDRALGQALGIGLYRPGITAPGVDINSMDALAVDCYDGGPGEGDDCYMMLSGTSMSGPHVAGAAGPVAQAFQTAHGRLPTPNELIEILERSAVTLPGVPAEAQGAGRLDVKRAVQLALDFPNGPVLTIGTPTPTYDAGAHPGADGARIDTQVGCTEFESWTRTVDLDEDDAGYGQHTITVPPRAERLQVTVDWSNHSQGSNLYLRLWKPGIDPDRGDTSPGPDRVYPDAESAGLVYLGFEDPTDLVGADGPSRTATLPMPEPGDWTLRVYHRSSPGSPGPCPGDSDESPQRSEGFAYDVLVDVPRYTNPPEVSLAEGARSGDIQQLVGEARFPRPTEGITTYGVAGTEAAVPGGDPDERPAARPGGIRVTDLTNRLRVAWDAVDGATSYQIHRSTDPDFSVSAASRVATVSGAECQAPNLPTWPGASRAGLCWTDADAAPGSTFYYRVAPVRAGAIDGLSLLGYGTAWPLDREVRVKVDRRFGPAYYEYAEPQVASLRRWTHDWDTGGVPNPAAPTARSFSQGVGSANARVGDALPAFGPAPGTAGDASIVRLEGASRIETAVEVSRSTYDAADTVVLARADDFPDALAGAPLATDLDAPLLLTYGDVLHPATAAEIARLGARDAVLLGGTAALPPVIADTLTGMDVAVDRVDGANRFDTAALIAERLDSGHQAAYIALGGHPDPGRGWPDALAVAPLAAFTTTPILLVSTMDEVPAETRAALSERGIGSTTIVGGTAAVPSGVQDELDAAGIATRRVAGPTRYETSRALFDEAAAAGMDSDRIWLATGLNWPDALTSGAVVGALGHSLLLVDGDDLARSEATRAVLVERSSTIDLVVLLGGTNAISALVADQVRSILD